MCQSPVRAMYGKLTTYATHSTAPTGVYSILITVNCNRFLLHANVYSLHPAQIITRFSASSSLQICGYFISHVSCSGSRAYSFVFRALNKHHKEFTLCCISRFLFWRFLFSSCLCISAPICHPFSCIDVPSPICSAIAPSANHHKHHRRERRVSQQRKTLCKCTKSGVPRWPSLQSTACACERR